MSISEEQISQLIELLREGVSIQAACKECGIGRRDLYRAFDKDKELQVRVDDAKRLGYCLKADELLADIERFEKEPGMTHEKVGQWRAAFMAKQWLFAKVLPKIYGDKLEVSGQIAGPPSISINIGSDATAKVIEGEVSRKVIEAKAQGENNEAEGE